MRKEVISVPFIKVEGTLLFNANSTFMGKLERQSVRGSGLSRKVIHQQAAWGGRTEQVRSDRLLLRASAGGGEFPLTSCLSDPTQDDISQHGQTSPQQRHPIPLTKTKV